MSIQDRGDLPLHLPIVSMEYADRSTGLRRDTTRDYMEPRWNFSRWFGSVLAPSPSLPAPARGADRPQSSVAILRYGILSFTARSTLGGFVGSTRAASGIVEGGLESAHGWVEAPVATLTTRNELRDRDMRAALESEKYPMLRFDLTRTEVLLDADSDGDTVAVDLHGSLSIHGVTRTARVPAILWFDDESIHLTAAFTLDVETYGIGGLTRLFGLLRMNREVEVSLELLFTRLNANEALRTE